MNLLNVQVEKLFVALLSISVLIAGCTLVSCRSSGDPAAPKYIAEDTILTIISEEAEAMGRVLSPSTEIISLALKGKPKEAALLTIDFTDEYQGIGLAYVNYKEKDSIFYEAINDLDDVVLMKDFGCNVGFYKVADHDNLMCIVDSIEEKDYSEKDLRKSLQAFASWLNQKETCSVSTTSAVLPKNATDSFPASGNSDYYATYGLKDLSELEEKSLCIIRGKLKDDAERQLIRSETTGRVKYGYTTSTLEVTVVYKGDLKVGDQITLGEEYYIDAFDGKDAVYNDSNYYPSEPEKEYLFFLRGYPADHPTFPGIYYPVAYELGRYPIIDTATRAAVNVDSYTNEQLNLGTFDSEGYREFFEEVIAEYMS